MVYALTRPVSHKLAQGELTFLARQPLDPALAHAQQQTYCEWLRHQGVSVLELPAAAALPDAVFVEDAAIVLDEIAVITRPGAASRRPECASVAAALEAFHPLAFIRAPGTLEGGDVLRIGHTLYVGLTTRTNAAGIGQLRAAVAPLGYQVQPVTVSGCLHLKTACTWLGAQTLLSNQHWVDVRAFTGFNILEVPASEPFAANTLTVSDTCLLPASFPRTRALLAESGYQVQTLDISELQKAEAGLTCLSILFTANQ